MSPRRPDLLQIASLHSERRTRAIVSEKVELSLAYQATCRVKPVIREDYCELTLSAGDWNEASGKYGSMYRVRVHWAG